MRTSRAIAFAAIVAATAAGSALAQKVAPAPTYFDNAVEAAMPADGATTTIPLTGLATARGAWLTFVRFSEGKPVQDAQVISLMEGVTVRWAGTNENCVHDLKLIPSPPAVTIQKSAGMCALKAPGNAIFRVLAM